LREKGLKVLTTVHPLEDDSFLLPQASNIEGFTLDLSKHEDVVSLASKIISKMENLAVIIYNAGLFNPKDKKVVEG
jgi:short-subunit dehydrogenase